MLYVNLSAEGRYVEDAKGVSNWVEKPVVPEISTKDGTSCYAFTMNGAYDCGLDIKVESADKCSVTLAPGEDNMVYILGQECTVGWVADSYYGRKRGNVRLYRLNKTDIIIYALADGSWFVSGQTVYHNDGGVLVKYNRDSVIGWETWESFMHTFLDAEVIGLLEKEKALSRLARQIPGMIRPGGRFYNL